MNMETNQVGSEQTVNMTSYVITDTNNTVPTNKTTPINLEPPEYIVVFFSIVYILIFIVGIVGNIVVITVITLSKSLKTSVNMYLMNLCLADVLVLVVCMPTALADIFTKEVWYFGEIMCKLVPTLENTVANASVLTILAISVERYRVVCYPLQGIDDSASKIAKIVVVVWITAIASSTPFFTIPELRNSKFHDGTPVQVCRNPLDDEWERIYAVLLCFGFFIFPCILLFALNLHLCRVLRVAEHNARYIQDINSRHDRRKRQLQVMNIIASIITIFFICHLPFRVVVLWFTFEDKRVLFSLGLERYLNILYSSRVMFYLNHALNPVIYSFVSTKFRCALRDLLTSDRKRSKTSTWALSQRRQHAGNRQHKTMSTPHSMAHWTTSHPRDDSLKSRLQRNDFYKDYNLANQDNQRMLLKDMSTSSDKDYEIKVEVVKSFT